MTLRLFALLLSILTPCALAWPVAAHDVKLINQPPLRAPRTLE